MALRWQRWLKGLALAALFAAGGLAVALLFPLCGAHGRGRGHALRCAVTCAWYRAVGRVLRLRVESSGSPLSAGLLVANHISWLDVIALGSRKPVAFIAKSEVARWPVIGFLARGSGTLFFRRGDARSSRLVSEQMVWRLRQSGPLLLFPEGTTSRGNQVLRFHARLLEPAVTARAPVQPVAIAYAGPAAAKVPFVGDDSFLPHLWALLEQEEITAIVHYGPALGASACRDELASRSRLYIQEQLGLSLEGPGAGCARNRLA